MQDDPFARAVERAQAAEQAEAQAKREKRQRQLSSGARTAFRTHFAVFIAVNLLLVVIWATTDTSYPWFLYPLGGWGVGIVAHFFATQSVMRRRESRYAPATPYATPVPAPTPAPAMPVAVAAAAPTPPTPSSSTTEDLHRLAELHQSGALTDEEFSAAKAKLLQ